MGVKEINSKTYELVPPDGGWGYVIAVAVTINLVTICAFLTCFGMIFKTLFIELEMDSTSITLLNGIGAFCIAISGLSTNSLLKYMSIRKLGLFAAVAYTLGTFCIIFVKSQFQFFICYAILQNIGHGLMFNVSCTVLSYYFVKRRFIAVSVTQTVVALSGLFSPLFTKWSIESFGFKGTILLITGIYLQSFVGMALMQPVKWHMKKVEIAASKDNEIKPLLISEQNKNEIMKSNTALDLEKVINGTDDKHVGEEQEHQYRGIKYSEIFLFLRLKKEE